jgi:glutamine amidotransferase
MADVAILDYGAGNVKSVQNMLKHLGYSAAITFDLREIGAAARVILPGVGAFPAAMRFIEEKNLREGLVKIAADKPFLGICLGMQLFFDSSHEIEKCRGLGLIPGEVRRIDTDQKLPHIGWNSLGFKRECGILNGVEENSYVYYAHTYMAYPENPEDVAAVSDYGTEVPGIVSRGNIIGFQFHPEKSAETGMQLMKNFCAL